MTKFTVFGVAIFCALSFGTVGAFSQSPEDEQVSTQMNFKKDIHGVSPGLTVDEVNRKINAVLERDIVDKTQPCHDNDDRSSPSLSRSQIHGPVYGCTKDVFKLGDGKGCNNVLVISCTSGIISRRLDDPMTF
jgi:hypothetical protein